MKQPVRAGVVGLRKLGLRKDCGAKAALALRCWSGAHSGAVLHKARNIHFHNADVSCPFCPFLWQLTPDHVRGTRPAGRYQLSPFSVAIWSWYFWHTVITAVASERHLDSPGDSRNLQHLLQASTSPTVG